MGSDSTVRRANRPSSTVFTSEASQLSRITNLAKDITLTLNWVVIVRQDSVVTLVIKIVVHG